MAVFTAEVKTMPLPGTPWNWETFYTWQYDALHQLLNITNTRLNPAPTVTPPASKENVP